MMFDHWQVSGIKGIPNDSGESLGAFLTIRPPELDGGKFTTDIYQFSWVH